jgi:acyl-CoA synthetase (AMP-forming)/AMP-acid ligase II
MAEATLFVAVATRRRRGVVLEADVDALQRGVLARRAGGAADVAGLLRAAFGLHVAIVDPASEHGAGAGPTGTVGEIWVHGPNVGRATGTSRRRRPPRSAAP